MYIVYVSFWQQCLLHAVALGHYAGEEDSVKEFKLPLAETPCIDKNR